MSNQRRCTAADLKLPNPKFLGKAGVALKRDFILGVQRKRENLVSLSGICGASVGDLVAIDIVIPSANHDMIWRYRQFLQQLLQPPCSFLVLRRLASICD